MNKRSKRNLRGRIGIAVMIIAFMVGSGFYAAYWLNNVYGLKEAEIQRLNEVVSRLNGESRVAQAMVTKQEFNPLNNEIETTIKFLEITSEGENLKPRFFTFKSDTIYFDALVIKFDLDYVERGEALRGKSIALFRRIFSENQAPENGFLMDEDSDGGAVPNIYRINKNPSELEEKLWKGFWGYAADPKEAAKLGVRVIQGEAVYTRFQPDNLYTLTLDHDGGLNIMTEPFPQILKTKTDNN